MDELELWVHELRVKQEIYEVLMRYCRGVDRLNVDLIRGAYHPDAVDDHGSFEGSAWDFADFIVEKKREATELTCHFVGNHLVVIEGRRATSEAYFVARQVRVDESNDRHLDVVQGRYLDVFEERDGAWKILKRRVVHDWKTTAPLASSGADYADAPAIQGTRGQDDPIFSLHPSIESCG